MIDRFSNLTGRVRIWNEAGDVVESSNLVVYTGGDILAQLLAGNDQYRIARMYFAFENTAGVPTAIAAARADLASFFHDLVAPQDFVDSPILQPTTLTAGDGNHTTNVATFIAIASAAVGVNGVTFSAAANSKVFSLGLVARPTGNIAGDVLYARYVLPTALPVVGTGQISATWATEAN